MFTYIDPSVRSRLIEQGKLRRINADGLLMDVGSADVPPERALEILGPIPLPIALTGAPITAQWYAFSDAPSSHGSMASPRNCAKKVASICSPR
jgi:GTP cyclohydrolase II